MSTLANSSDKKDESTSMVSQFDFNDPVEGKLNALASADRCIEQGDLVGGLTKQRDKLAKLLNKTGKSVVSKEEDPDAEIESHVMTVAEAKSLIEDSHEREGRYKGRDKTTRFLQRYIARKEKRLGIKPLREEIEMTLTEMNEAFANDGIQFWLASDEADEQGVWRLGAEIELPLPHDQVKAIQTIRKLRDRPECSFVYSVVFRRKVPVSILEELFSKEWPNLRYLGFQGCFMGPEGAKALAEAENLRNLNLAGLELKCNSIGDEGAQALATSKHFQNLDHLGLSYNYISDEGAQAFADPETMPNLTYLSLQDNQISAALANDLAELRRIKDLRIGRGIWTNLPQ